MAPDDLLALSCGLHRIDWLMRSQALKALRTFSIASPQSKPQMNCRLHPCLTAAAWLYVVAVITCEWWAGSMSAAMTARPVTDELVMAIWRRGKPMSPLHTPIAAAQTPSEQFNC